MRYYICDYEGDVWGDFEDYDTACYELDNYDEELRGQLQILNMQNVTDIKDKYGLSWGDMLLVGKLEV